MGHYKTIILPLLPFGGQYHEKERGCACKRTSARRSRAAFLGGTKGVKKVSRLRQSVRFLNFRASNRRFLNSRFLISAIVLYYCYCRPHLTHPQIASTQNQNSIKILPQNPLSPFPLIIMLLLRNFNQIWLTSRSSTQAGCVGFAKGTVCLLNEKPTNNVFRSVKEFPY